jgi:hypothetical protein
MPAAIASHVRQRVNAAEHTRQPRRRRITVAGISDLRWPTRLVPREPAAATSTSSNEGPGLTERSPASALSAEHELGGVPTDAHCHHPQTRSCPRAEKGQNAFPGSSTKSHHSARSERLPPIGPTNLPPAHAGAADPWAATGTLTWPPRAQLPTRIHAQSCALDPTTSPAIHRSCGATCRLPTSAVFNPRAHQEPPKPRRHCNGKPLRDRVGPSCEAPSRILKGQGVRCASRVGDPPS